MRNPPRNEGPFYRVRDRTDAADAVARDRSAGQPTPGPVVPEDQGQQQKRISPPIPDVDTSSSILEAQRPRRSFEQQ
jgi:hypothetical protein